MKLHPVLLLRILQILLLLRMRMLDMLYAGIMMMTMRTTIEIVGIFWRRRHSRRRRRRRVDLTVLDGVLLREAIDVWRHGLRMLPAGCTAAREALDDGSVLEAAVHPAAAAVGRRTAAVIRPALPGHDVRSRRALRRTAGRIAVREVGARPVAAAAADRLAAAVRRRVKQRLADLRVLQALPLAVDNAAAADAAASDAVVADECEGHEDDNGTDRDAGDRDERLPARPEEMALVADGQRRDRRRLVVRCRTK